MQSMPITTNLLSLNPVHDEVYSIDHYVIKSVSDSRQVGDFLRVLLFPPPTNLTATICRNVVESGIKHHKAKPNQIINMESRLKLYHTKNDLRTL
jgi:hypothetical protein